MTLPVMDCIATLHAATTDVRNTDLGDSLTEQAALLLVGEVARHLASQDQIWSAVTLSALDVSQRLHPEPAPILLDAAPAPADSREVRAAMVELLTALADGYDTASADRTVIAPRALALGAAAIQLRRCADLLT